MQKWLLITLLVVFSPLWLALLMILLSFVLVWVFVSHIFEYPTLSNIVGTGTILGLLIKRAGTEYAAANHVLRYSNITFDCGVIAVAFLALTLLSSIAARRLQKPLAWLAALTCLAYVIVKAALIKTESFSADTNALLVLSALLPAFQLAITHRIWRHATPEGCIHYEKEILQRECKTPFVHKKVAGMHTLEFLRPGDSGAGSSTNPMLARDPDTRPVIVMCHGYMSGTAMYMFNFDDLTTDYKVYSVDWLGCAGSDRPKFNCPDTAATEDFFLDALEQWRRELRIDSFVLMGHSMGGYLCAVYAMRHPARVSHLLLVSPGGVPTYAAVNPNAATGGMVPSIPNNPTPRPIPKWLWSTVSLAWDNDVTPGILIRLLGPLGPWMSRGGVAGRFRRLVLSRKIDPITLRLMGMYYYHNLASDGSGEYALRHIFLPGAKAVHPIGERLLSAASAGHLRQPITFIYGGTHDWMSAGAGRHYAEKLRAFGIRSNVHLISPGGHHLYLESPQSFNATVLQELAVTFTGRGDVASDDGVIKEAPDVLSGKDQEVNGAASPQVRRTPSVRNQVIDAVSTME